MKTTQSPQQLLDATKRTQYVDKTVLATFPKQQEGTLEFFKLDKYISDDDLEKEYESRGLIPADPYTLLNYDLSNRAEIDEKKDVFTHWKDSKGKWCYIAFDQWRGDERRVIVDRDDYGWRGLWWVAGLRKFSTQSSKTKNCLDTLSLDLQNAIDVVKKGGYQVSKIL